MPCTPEYFVSFIISFQVLRQRFSQICSGVTELLLHANKNHPPPHRNHPQAGLLCSFCPVLRFDAAEKHYPVCAEIFISSSLLLRRPKNPQVVKKLKKRQQNLKKAGVGNKADEVDHTDSVRGSGDGDGNDDGAGAGADDGDDHSGDGAAAGEQNHQEKMQQPQACGECGQRQGWNIPSDGGWTLVGLPPGAQSWSTSTLLDEQRRDILHEFRCEMESSSAFGGCVLDHSLVPCCSLVTAGI